MENWDILDEFGNPTGRLVERGKPMRQDEYHLVVHVWIVNPQNKFFISKRALVKPFGGKWETTGGSTIAGETSLQASLCETKEELGIDLNPDDCKLFIRIKRQTDFPYFVNAWLCKYDGGLSTLRPDPSEVSEARWADKGEIVDMINHGTFMKVFPYLDKLFETI